MSGEEFHPEMASKETPTGSNQASSTDKTTVHQVDNTKGTDESVFARVRHRWLSRGKDKHNKHGGGTSSADMAKPGSSSGQTARSTGGTTASMGGSSSSTRSGDKPAESTATPAVQPGAAGKKADNTTGKEKTKQRPKPGKSKTGNEQTGVKPSQASPVDVEKLTPRTKRKHLSSQEENEAKKGRPASSPKAEDDSQKPSTANGNAATLDKSRKDDKAEKRVLRQISQLNQHPHPAQSRQGGGTAPPESNLNKNQGETTGNLNNQKLFMVTDLELQQMKKDIKDSILSEIRISIKNLIDDGKQDLMEQILPIFEEHVEVHAKLREDLSAAIGNMVRDEQLPDRTEQSDHELKGRMEKLETRVEMLDITSREEILVIDGIVPKHDENLNEQVRDTLNSNMDLGIKPSEIVHTTFLGPRPENPNGKRSIRVKVNDMRLKKSIMKRKGQLRGTEIYVKEHLTPRNNSIFYHA